MDLQSQVRWSQRAWQPPKATRTYMCMHACMPCSHAHMCMHACSQTCMDLQFKVRARPIPPKAASTYMCMAHGARPPPLHGARCMARYAACGTTGSMPHEPSIEVAGWLCMLPPPPSQRQAYAHTLYQLTCPFLRPPPPRPHAHTLLSVFFVRPPPPHVWPHAPPPLLLNVLKITMSIRIPRPSPPFLTSAPQCHPGCAKGYQLALALALHHQVA